MSPGPVFDGEPRSERGPGAASSVVLPLQFLLGSVGSPRFGGSGHNFRHSGLSCPGRRAPLLLFLCLLRGLWLGFEAEGTAETETKADTKTEPGNCLLTLRLWATSRWVHIVIKLVVAFTIR